MQVTESFGTPTLQDEHDGDEVEVEENVEDQENKEGNNNKKRKAVSTNKRRKGKY